MPTGRALFCPGAHQASWSRGVGGRVGGGGGGRGAPAALLGITNEEEEDEEEEAGRASGEVAVPPAWGDWRGLLVSRLAALVTPISILVAPPRSSFRSKSVSMDCRVFNLCRAASEAFFALSITIGAT